VCENGQKDAALAALARLLGDALAQDGTEGNWIGAASGGLTPIDGRFDLARVAGRYEAARAALFGDTEARREL
jgi:hypothetical protein